VLHCIDLDGRLDSTYTPTTSCSSYPTNTHHLSRHMQLVFLRLRTPTRIIIYLIAHATSSSFHSPAHSLVSGFGTYLVFIFYITPIYLIAHATSFSFHSLAHSQFRPFFGVQFWHWIWIQNCIGYIFLIFVCEGLFAMSILGSDAKLVQIAGQAS
jgi:hypothetical protein